MYTPIRQSALGDFTNSTQKPNTTFRKTQQQSQQYPASPVTPLDVRCTNTNSSVTNTFSCTPSYSKPSGVTTSSKHVGQIVVTSSPVMVPPSFTQETTVAPSLNNPSHKTASKPHYSAIESFGRPFPDAPSGGVGFGEIMVDTEAIFGCLPLAPEIHVEPLPDPFDD
eukprot:PhF_6_TR30761/c0_g1_i1/m.45305